MMLIKKYLILIILILAMLLLGGMFVGGYKYHQWSFKCPEIKVDTILIYDTIPHYIIDKVPYYITKTDTILYPDTIYTEVDTLAILKNYYALNVYNREWKDTLIRVTIIDTITQNRSIGNKFEYQLLRPQTIINNTIDNTVTYNSYLSLGIDVPLMDVKYLEIEGIYNWNRAYVGMGYTPELKSINLKAGITIFKFKK